MHIVNYWNCMAHTSLSSMIVALVAAVQADGLALGAPRSRGAGNAARHPARALPHGARELSVDACVRLGEEGAQQPCREDGRGRIDYPVEQGAYPVGQQTLDQLIGCTHEHGAQHRL